MNLEQVGCSLCNATWGDYWEEIEGKKLFFCCEVCARQYETIVHEAKKRKGWNSIGKLEMEGDHRGRTCKVTNGTESYSFVINFFDDGKIRTFVELS